MKKPHKDLLRTIVIQLRRLLGGYWDEHGDYHRGDLDRELERLGFDPTGTLLPLDGLRNPTPTQERAHRVAAAQLATLPTDATAKVVINLRNDIIERAAYSWINRLLALRTMEVRGLMEETLRPSYDGVSEALFILRETDPQRTIGPDGGWWAIIEDACAALTPILPGLFDLTDPNTALRPSTPILLEALKLVGGNHASFSRVGEEVHEALFQDPDVIGWAYQFYQEEAKARVYAKLGAGGKVETRSEIAAATQLFTESYMVQWMLQNSLGRNYHEAYPSSNLPATWAYYILPESAGDQCSGHSVTFLLDQLTFLDPAMGSGHILREAFDMFFAMYREQHPEMTPDEVANRILAYHLHGIDIDPRAAQLAALTLVLRAHEKCSRPLTTGGLGRGLNLATTPTGLDHGSLERHLARHPEDELYRPVLAGLFAALEQAPMLGSLLRLGEHLDEAIAAFKAQQKGGQLGLADESANLNRLLNELARHDPAALKAMLLENVSRSFRRDAQLSDVNALLLGREAVAGLHLLELLERKYAVIVTNPPYMGSKNMADALKKYVERHYKPGKRDLYAAFILRSLELTRYAGRVGMITQQSWMFLKSFADLRAVPNDKLAQAHQREEFTGLLRETAIEGMAHLGANAFEEISGEVVQSTMFILRKQIPSIEHRMVAFRAAVYPSPEEKNQLLKTSKHLNRFAFHQSKAFLIERAPLAYWLTDKLLDLFQSMPTSGSTFYIRQGICTTNNIQFVRYTWELATQRQTERWHLFSKGGGVKRWSGLDQSLVDWEYNGMRIKSYQEDKPGAIHWSGRMPDSFYFFRPGWTFTRVSGGTLALREIPEGSLFGHTSPAVVAFGSNNLAIVSFWLNTYLYTFLLRALTQSLSAQEGYVQKLPLPNALIGTDAERFIELPLRNED